MEKKREFILSITTNHNIYTVSDVNPQISLLGILQ